MFFDEKIADIRSSFTSTPPPASLSVPPSLSLPPVSPHSLPSQTLMFPNSSSPTALPLAPSTLSPHPSFRQLHQTSSHSLPPLWTPPCPLDVSPHPSRRPTSPHYWRNPLWTPPLFRTTVQYHSFHLFLKPLKTPLTTPLPSFLRITCWTTTSPDSDLATRQRLLLTVKESLQTAQAASLSSVLILLDLSAAFDTVNHSILLSSMAATGICGTALDWIKSHLSGRSSQVTWAGNVSTPRALVTGVPQGSVPSSSQCTLGPLVLLSLLMACPNTAMLMIPNSYSPFSHLTHRSLPGSLPAWETSRSGWTTTIWSSTQVRQS